MNTSRLLVTAVMVGLLFGVCAQAKEKDVNMPKETTVKGKVEVTKDASGTVTAVMIKTWDMTYHVTLDAKGMELGSMEGKHVDAKGTVMKKDREHWLTVMSYEERMQKKEKPAK